MYGGMVDSTWHSLTVYTTPTWVEGEAYLNLANIATQLNQEGHIGQINEWKCETAQHDPILCHLGVHHRVQRPISIYQTLIACTPLLQWLPSSMINHIYDRFNGNI